MTWKLFYTFLICLLLKKCDGKRASSKSYKGSLQKCNLRMEHWDTSEKPTLVAVAKLRGELIRPGCHGYVVFEQQKYRYPIKISGKISGLEAEGTHGMFITQLGIKGCNWKGRGGKHYNPLNATHGDSSSCWRHIGDIEAVTANEHGTVDFVQYDARVQLQGPTSVIGRGVVILFKSDDSTSENSVRVACGVIAFARETNFTVSKYVTPGPQNGYFYHMGVVLMICMLLATLKFGKMEYDNREKRRIKYESNIIKERTLKKIARTRWKSFKDHSDAEVENYSWIWLHVFYKVEMLVFRKLFGRTDIYKEYRLP